MSAALTDWFPADVRPERVGIYERDDRGTSMDDGEPNYSYWDGEKWRMSGWSTRAALAIDRASSEQDLPWRGLAADPATGAAS